MGRFARALDGAIIKELTDGLNDIANRARSNASWSSTIPGAIYVGKVEATPSGYDGTVQLDLGEAPEAAAFEWGSGIHRTKGTPGTYVIKPRTGAALGIPFENWPDFEPPARRSIPIKKMIGIGRTGKIVVKYVDHPGVEPNPFMQPALDSWKPSFKFRLAKAFRKAVFGAFPRVEVIE